LPIVVVVDDGNGYRSVYVHLASASVKAGQHVAAGKTALGREGRTGDATGCHLHYELIRTDGAFIPVAPQEVATWHYPPFVRERVDPLLVLDPLAPNAARQVPGNDPPRVSPSGPTNAAIMATWAQRDALPGSPRE
jgi:murein DD-endopeptidase MepM/ murein hydrolase activator NlpD